MCCASPCGHPQMEQIEHVHGPSVGSPQCAHSSSRGRGAGGGDGDSVAVHVWAGKRQTGTQVVVRTVLVSEHPRMSTLCGCGGTHVSCVLEVACARARAYLLDDGRTPVSPRVGGRSSTGDPSRAQLPSPRVLRVPSALPEGGQVLVPAQARGSLVRARQAKSVGTTAGLSRAHLHLPQACRQRPGADARRDLSPLPRLGMAG